LGETETNVLGEIVFAPLDESSFGDIHSGVIVVIELLILELFVCRLVVGCQRH